MTDDKPNYCGSGKLFIIVVFGNTVQKSVNQNSIVSTEHKITNSRTDFHLPICTVEIMFNQSGIGGFTNTTVTNTNPMKDYEVVQPPDDSISSLAFSPSTLPQNFLIAGSWDNNVRCWEIEQSGTSIPKSMQSCGAPVLDVAWSDDGTKVGCGYYSLLNHIYIDFKRFSWLVVINKQRCGIWPAIRWYKWQFMMRLLKPVTGLKHPTIPA